MSLVIAETLVDYPLTPEHRTRTICEYNSPDAKIIRQVPHKFGISCDRVWSAIVIKP